MPVETHGVAYAVGEHFLPAPIRIHTCNGPEPLILTGPVADVAWRPDRDVELAVRPKPDELPAMRSLRRKGFVDDHCLRRIPEATFDAVVPQDPIHLSHIERSVPERDAIGHVETGGQRHHLVGSIVLVAVEHGIHVPGLAGADEQRASRRPRHRTRVRHVRRIDLDRETRGQRDPVERTVLRARGCGGTGSRDRHRRVHADHVRGAADGIAWSVLGQGDATGGNGQPGSSGGEASQHGSLHRAHALNT